MEPILELIIVSIYSSPPCGDTNGQRTTQLAIAVHFSPYCKQKLLQVYANAWWLIFWQAWLHY